MLPAFLRVPSAAAGGASTEAQLSSSHAIHSLKHTAVQTSHVRHAGQARIWLAEPLHICMHARSTGAPWAHAMQ